MRTQYTFEQTFEKKMTKNLNNYIYVCVCIFYKKHGSFFSVYHYVGQQIPLTEQENSSTRKFPSIIVVYSWRSSEMNKMTIQKNYRLLLKLSLLQSKSFKFGQ